MKVLHLISGGDIGGAKTHIEELLPKLNELENVDAELLCVIESTMSEECRKKGVKVEIIPQKTRYDLAATRKMAEYFNKNDFDILHCHGARANFIALFLRRKIKKPMITTIHSDYKLDFIGSKYKKMVYTPLNAYSLKKFKHFITISEQFRRMLISRGFKKEQIDVIHHGIDFDKPQEFIDKQEFLDKYDVTPPEGAALIGCVTRLHPAKGVDVLLKSLVMLFENDVNAYVLIAGSGDEKPELVNFAEKHGLTDRVKFLGHIKDINSFYNAIDINVLPSISEGFGLTLIEGARFKLSTIASKAGGIPEIIKDGKTGILFNVGNFKELYEALLNNLQNMDEGRQRGEEFYADAKLRFSSDAMAKRHLEVYETLKGEEK